MGGGKIAVAERAFDLESTLILNLFIFSGVGRESEPVFRRNESWLAGSRPAWIRFHTLFLLPAK